VAESIAPIVKVSLGKPIDLVVARETAAGTLQLRVALSPRKWAGQGLLGCRLK